MRSSHTMRRALLAGGLAIGTLAAPGALTAQTVQSGTDTVQLSTGRGRLVTLTAPMSDLFVANPAIADVQVRSPTQLYIFGKAAGETTVSATARGGRVVYFSTVRVGNNFDSIGSMLQMALPEAQIAATPMNGLVLLTGVVAAPDDAAEAERLVQAFVGEGTKVLSRLRTATPLQVNLRVKFAEVSRSFIKNIGVNLQTRGTSGDTQTFTANGRNIGTIGPINTANFPLLDASAQFGLPAGSLRLPFNPATGQFVTPNSGTQFDIASLGNKPERSAIALATRLAGLDLLAAIDLGETMGQVTTLAEPNLSVRSGDTGSFLAGGEIPIPINQGLGAVGVEFKQFGVSLAYAPTVLADGRISIRVRPEVSQLSAAGAVTIGGTQIPALTTRRAETTVELGSGQSFMIAGLMQNNHSNTFSKTPGVGDIPIIGALFRSNGWQRNETELVIVITPYLVKPVNANDIVLPTDGYKAPSDVERILLGTLAKGESGGDRPKPRAVDAAPPGAVIGAGTPAPVTPADPPPAPRAATTPAPMPATRARKGGSAMPGFSQ